MNAVLFQSVISIFILLLLEKSTFVTSLQLFASCFLNGERSSVLMRTNPVIFCSDDDSSILFGDFTGNGAVDLLCHRNSSGQITLFNFQSTQVLPLNREFCTNGKKIMSADLNGDSKLDLLCHQADGSIQYLLNYGLGGLFTPVTGELMDIYSCNDVIFVGDFNRDGKADLFCHDSNEHVHYAFSNSINDNVSFGGLLTNSLKWCDGPSDVIVPGFLNADNGLDLLCHANRSFLESVLSYSLENETFVQEKLEGNLVGFCKREKEFLLVRDINGDGYDDLVCKSSTISGETTIVQNKPGQYFTGQSVRNEFRFCANGGPKNFYVEDVNNDGLSDLICQTSVGKRFVFLSRCFF